MGSPNVIVVGGGTVGLAAAWAIARRGCPVTVLERHEHVHEFGSHGGFTRAIRHAYHEGESYVPLVREADDAWVALGRRRGAELLVRAGLLEFGAPDDPEYVSAIEACQLHEIDHDLLDAKEAMSRWPFRIPHDWGACYTPSGGYLRVVPCLDALRDEARDAGAQFRYGAQVVQIDPQGTVHLADGERLRADRIVVTAGAGLPELLGATLPPLRVLRRALLWTRPADADREALRGIPVWGAFVPDGFFYGFPWNDEGVEGLKLACHRRRDGEEVPVDPETVNRDLRPDDVDLVRNFARTYFPGADSEIADHSVCLYTATDSWDFIVDRWRESDRVFIAGGLSGHGFKFAPALGRVLADMATDDAPGPPQFELR